MSVDIDKKLTAGWGPSGPSPCGPDPVHGKARIDSTKAAGALNPAEPAAESTALIDLHLITNQRVEN